VLRGQAVRSNAGLYYENYGEFVEALRVLDGTPHIASTIGQNGSRFFRNNYGWPVIERKYLEMFERLSKEDAGLVARRPAPELPGWWGRRQKTLPPAREVLAGLPAGPVLTRGEPRDGRPHRDGRETRDTRPAGEGGDSRGGRDIRPPRSSATVAVPSNPSVSTPPAQDRTQRRDDGRQRGRDGRPRRTTPAGVRPSAPPGTPRPGGNPPGNNAAPADREGQPPRGNHSGRHRRGRRPGGRPARKGEA